MKRRIAIVLLLLIGGATVNVAVAWGLVLIDPTAVDRELGVTTDELGGWAVIRWRRFGSVLVYSGAHSHEERPVPPHPRELLPAWSGLAEMRREAMEERIATGDFTQQQFLWQLGRGWPAVSLICEFVRERQSYRGLPRTLSPRHAIHLSGEGQLLYSGPVLPKVLPIRPTWPGFIINTLFYALLLWLLLFAPFAARRMLRRRRGLCEECAYPLGVSPVCTECGAAVSTSLRRSAGM